MSHFNDDDNEYTGSIYDDGGESKAIALDKLKALGYSLLFDRVSPKDNVRGAGRTAKQNQMEFRRFYRENRDPQAAFWKCFKIVYPHLQLDAWDGSMKLKGCNRLVTLSQLVHDLEEALDTICKLNNEQLSRKIKEAFSAVNPVQEYLYKLPQATDEDVKMFQGLAKTLFGASQDQMAQVKLSRWLIGAVARGLEPGCKMDTALVIRGKQGVGKTTVLEALFGKYFRTLHSSKNDTEQQRILQQAWGCELGEIEATFRTKDISALKAFLTERNDSLRDLYKDLGAPKPRHCVFAGTTNEAAFLNDPTGSRRFWIIDVDSHDIPVEWVKENRDRIWSVALKFYNDQEQHWLTDDEADLNETYNKTFQSENSFVGTLAPMLAHYEQMDSVAGKGIAVSISDVMTAILEIKPESHTRNNRQVASALAELGYIKKRVNNKLFSGNLYVSASAKEPCVLKLWREAGGTKVESFNWATTKEQREYKAKQAID